MKKYLILLLLSFIVTTISAQSRTIKGTVLDELNEPLIGASIIIKGNANYGTVTDFDGKFSLTLQPEQDIIVVNFIGYISQEVKIQDVLAITIVMKPDNQTLDEVVVVGYGIQAKKSMVSASYAVKASSTNKKEDKKATTWKRSGMSDNSIRLQVGDDDYIPLESAQMAVSIDGFRVRVLMDCFFYNNKGSGLEGVFKLKLPTDATPFYFAFGETEYINMKIDDKTKQKTVPFTKYSADLFNYSYQDISDLKEDSWERVREARIVSKQKAARAYEQTVSAAIDPALMEWGGADMFSCRVFPLSDKKLHRIVIGYDLNMTEALDFREYILSLPKVEKDLKIDMAVYESPELQAEIPATLEAVSQTGFRTYYSKMNPKEKEYTIRYNTNEPILLVQTVEDTQEIDGYKYKSESIAIPYFAANYKVELPEVKQENLPSDAVFLLDVSISSNPDKFNVWLKLIDEILSQNQDVIKRFAVMTFGIHQEWHTRYYQKNNYYNKSQFLNYANTLSLEGATNLASALKEGSSPEWAKKDASKPKHIFLMSDADCNWGETNMHAFQKLINKGDCIHTYKTGLSGTNSAILNYLSRISGGFAFTVTGEEEAALTAKSFRYRPWNIESVKVEGVEDFLIAGNPTQLYNGQKLIFTGRNIPKNPTQLYNGLKLIFTGQNIPTGNLTIAVNNGLEKRIITYNANVRINSSLASRVYGQIASSYLENYGYQAEEAATNYSTYYRVPGQYTSFLMLESDWDHDRYGIDDGDAEDFVKDNLVLDLVEEYENAGGFALLGEGKTDFMKWLEKFEDSPAGFTPDDEFSTYLESLPDGIFNILLKQQNYRVLYAEQQTGNELERLEDDDIRFDSMYKLAQRRKSSYGKADALKLLSSVVERNAADIQAIRDVAMAAISWDMGDQAYFLMRRIIDWREGEALAYLTAAEALQNAGYVDMSLIYYYLTLNGNWDRDYGSIGAIAALKCLKYINQISDTTVYTITPDTREFISYLRNEVIEFLDIEGFEEPDEADLIVVVSWNINDTDIDLHVLEPTGEKCYYGNSYTKIGGRLTIDVTSGYGPEMYVLKKAVPGKYSIMLDYYSDSGTQTASKAKAYIDIYRDWGRKTEKVTSKVIELKRNNWEDYDDDDDESDKRKVVMEFRIR